MNDHINDDRADDENRDRSGDDEIMRRISIPPEFPPASREQIERTWQAIADHVEAHGARHVNEARPARNAPRRRVADWLASMFPVATEGVWQLAKVAALVVVGFGAAWLAAGRGWLPGTAAVVDGPPVEADAGAVAVPDRTWMAAGDYGSRLEALLLGVAKGDATGGDVAPAAREVSRQLLNDNRLYQRVAQRRGDAELSELLSRMEIILLSLATAPEGQEQETITALREFIDESDVLGDLREVRSSVPHMPRPRAATAGS